MVKITEFAPPDKPGTAEKLKRIKRDSEIPASATPRVGFVPKIV
jgi:hypothetical protein